MLYKLLLLLLIFSCKSINRTTIDINIKVNTTSPEYKKNHALIEQKLKYLFATQSAEDDCILDYGIKKNTTMSGFSSTTFAVNQNISYNVNYKFSCKSGIKTTNFFSIERTMTLSQEKTVSKYAGEVDIDEDLSMKIADTLFDEIKMFIILKKNLTN